MFASFSHSRPIQYRQSKTIDTTLAEQNKRKCSTQKTTNLLEANQSNTSKHTRNRNVNITVDVVVAVDADEGVDQEGGRGCGCIWQNQKIEVQVQVKATANADVVGRVPVELQTAEAVKWGVGGVGAEGGDGF